MKQKLEILLTKVMPFKMLLIFLNYKFVKRKSRQNCNLYNNFYS